MKATAIYHAPEGDAKSCTMNGVIFNDGEPVELNSDDHSHLMSKLGGNQHFEFEVSADDEKPKRGPGRPPKDQPDDKPDDKPATAV